MKAESNVSIQLPKSTTRRGEKMNLHEMLSEIEYALSYNSFGTVGWNFLMLERQEKILESLDDHYYHLSLVEDFGINKSLLPALFHDRMSLNELSYHHIFIEYRLPELVYHEDNDCTYLNVLRLRDIINNYRWYNHFSILKKAVLKVLKGEVDFLNPEWLSSLTPAERIEAIIIYLRVKHRDSLKYLLSLSEIASSLLDVIYSTQYPSETITLPDYINKHRALITNIILAEDPLLKIS